MNLSQSTNDVYPTAVNIATIFAIDDLLDAMRVLQEAFATKAVEFADTVKMGRTQLQDAVPMTLGQEFATYSVMIDEDRTRLDEAALLVHEINLGATAIGTGLNAPAATPRQRATRCGNSPDSPSSWPRTWSRQPRTSVSSSTSRACSSGSRSSCPRCATTSACCRRGRARA